VMPTEDCPGLLMFILESDGDAEGARGDDV